jgi:hypothetical protein
MKKITVLAALLITAGLLNGQSTLSGQAAIDREKADIAKDEAELARRKANVTNAEQALAEQKIQLKERAAEAFKKSEEEYKKLLQDIDQLGVGQAGGSPGRSLTGAGAGTNWSISLDVLKPGTRVFFDIGKDDEGEIDLFQDGKLGLTLEMLSLAFNYHWEQIRVGPFVSAGISSANNQQGGDAVVFMWSAGLAVEHTEIPVALEVGVMQGISADETKDSKTRDDTAVFMGLNFNRLIGKKTLYSR